uniref:GIY-YIG domain-containing protein n=1 Tax=Rhabditophanes sp. KR3021 TaxID=114890 RepID=A0AC35TTC0_9BILA
MPLPKQKAAKLASSNTGEPRNGVVLLEEMLKCHENDTKKINGIVYYLKGETDDGKNYWGKSIDSKSKGCRPKDHFRNEELKEKNIKNEWINNCGIENKPIYMYIYDVGGCYEEAETMLIRNQWERKRANSLNNIRGKKTSFLKKLQEIELNSLADEVYKYVNDALKWSKKYKVSFVNGKWEPLLVEDMRSREDKPVDYGSWDGVFEESTMLSKFKSLVGEENYDRSTTLPPYNYTPHELKGSKTIEQATAMARIPPTLESFGTAFYHGSSKKYLNDGCNLHSRGRGHFCPSSLKHDTLKDKYIKNSSSIFFKVTVFENKLDCSRPSETLLLTKFKDRGNCQNDKSGDSFRFLEDLTKRQKETLAERLIEDIISQKNWTVYVFEKHTSLSGIVVYKCHCVVYDGDECDVKFRVYEPIPEELKKMSKRERYEKGRELHENNTEVEGLNQFLVNYYLNANAAKRLSEVKQRTKNKSLVESSKNKHESEWTEEEKKAVESDRKRRSASATCYEKNKSLVESSKNKPESEWTEEEKKARKRDRETRSASATCYEKNKDAIFAKNKEDRALAKSASSKAKEDLTEDEKMAIAKTDKAKAKSKKFRDNNRDTINATKNKKRQFLTTKANEAATMKSEKWDNDHIDAVNKKEKERARRSKTNKLCLSLEQLKINNDEKLSE